MDDSETVANKYLAHIGFKKIEFDPFDRLLVAQSIVEGITLLTADPLVGHYPAPVQMV